MKRIRRSFEIFIMFFMLLLLIAGCAWSAAPAVKFPIKPVKVFVGRAAGGSTDVVIRAIQPFVSKYLGQPVVIENIPDSGGKIAFRQAYQAAPDGYTLLFFGPSSDILSEVVEEVTDYTFKDFVPIANIGGGDAIMLITRKDSPIKTFNDLILAIKERPVTFSKVTGINGADLCLAMMLDAVGGIPMENLVFVPFGGGNETVTAVMGGHVDVAMPNPSVVADFVNNGELNALITFSRLPSASLPQVSTFDSLYSGNYISMLTGCVAPPGTPPEIVAILEDAFMKALADPEFLAIAKDTLAIEPMDSKTFGKTMDYLYTMTTDKLPILRQILEQVH